MLLVILGFVSGSDVKDATIQQDLHFAGANPPLNVTVYADSDETFAKGRTTLLTVKLDPKKRGGNSSGVSAKLNIVQNNASKFKTIAQSDDLALNSALSWKYIVTPVVGGHSEMVVLFCGYRHNLNLGCDDWPISFYVQQWLVPPGLINISNRSALVALLSSGTALAGAASEMYKKRLSVPAASVPKQDAVPANGSDTHVNV